MLSTQVLKLVQLYNENYLSHHGNYVKHLTLKATVAQPVHYCPWSQNGFSFTLNQANDFHHSMKPQTMISILIFTFYIVNQICFIILYQIRLLFLIFEIKYCLTEVLEQPGEGAELSRLTSGRYATNVTQTSINKERYWLTPTLLHITARPRSHNW